MFYYKISLIYIPIAYTYISRVTEKFLRGKGVPMLKKKEGVKPWSEVAVTTNIS